MTTDADFFRGQTVANEILEARRELDALRDRVATDKAAVLAQIALAAALKRFAIEEHERKRAEEWKRPGGTCRWVDVAKAIRSQEAAASVG